MYFRESRTREVRVASLQEGGGIRSGRLSLEPIVIPRRNGSVPQREIFHSEESSPLLAIMLGSGSAATSGGGAADPLCDAYPPNFLELRKAEVRRPPLP